MLDLFLIETRVLLQEMIEGNEKHKKSTASDKVAIIEFLYDRLFKHDDKPFEIDDTPFYEDDAFNAYPMLTMIDSLGYNTTWSTFFDYIKLIDRS